MRAGCLLMLFALVAGGCGGSATAPSAAVVTVSISPNPLLAPAPGAPLTWSVTYTETAGVGVRIDRNEMVVVDAAGVTAAQRTEFLAPGTCAVCNGAMRVEAGRSATVSGMTAAFLGAPRPGTFRFTVFFTDDKGHALSSTVTVSVSS